MCEYKSVCVCLYERVRVCKRVCEYERVCTGFSVTTDLIVGLPFVRVTLCGQKLGNGLSVKVNINTSKHISSRQSWCVCVCVCVVVVVESPRTNLEVAILHSQDKRYFLHLHHAMHQRFMLLIRQFIKNCHIY